MALPVLHTQRLMLRERALADVDACVAMDRDSEVQRFVTLPSAEAAHRAFIEGRIRCKYPDGLGYWSCLSMTSFVGWVLLIPRETVGPEVEMGWRFVREARGRGYATEAGRAVLEHAFCTVGLHSVIADIDDENFASIRVAEKLGFTLQATWLDHGRPTRRYMIERA